MELCGLLEFHPLYIAQGATHSLSPYLLAGVGCFHFQPEANINGSWSMLRPLHTEGQGFREFPERREYQLQQINFPVGMGVRYEMSTYAIFRLECIYRLLKTDYLDDVSTTYIDPKIFDLYYSADAAALAKTLADRTVELDPTHKTIPASLRGNPKNKDAYFSFNLKFSVVLNRKRK
jgi:hypothetical protein